MIIASVENAHLILQGVENSLVNLSLNLRTVDRELGVNTTQVELPEMRNRCMSVSSYISSS
jgi:hypothetical protein